MSTQTQNNVMSVLIGGDVAGTAIATLVSANNINALPEGQIVAVGMRASTGKEEILPTTATAATYPSIRLVAMNSGQLNYSARIFARDVNTFKGIDGVAGTTEQVTTIGYNGTTGSIDNSSTEYLLTYVGDWDDMMWSEQKYRKVYDYATLSPTQQGIAQTLSSNFNLDSFRSNNQGVAPQVKCEVLCDGTAADWTSAGTVAVVNGSNIVTLSATSANAQVVGAILRLGSTGSGVTTDVPVYIVTATPSTDSSLTSTQLRIHTFFQGTTAAALDATSGDAGIVATATNWGLKFTGLPLTWGIPPYSDFKFNKVTFHFDLKGFGATTVSNPTTASRGQGDYREVAEFEYFSQGNDGALNRTVIPLPTGRHYTDVTGTIPAYDTIAIESADTQRASAITRTAAMRIQSFVFIPDTSNGNTMSGLLLSQLNPWMASSPVSLPNVSV
tara:strand:+ start:59373 stop:60701 length:1329 start_codon:yes stop_codon:yes gene_type:complete